MSEHRDSIPEAVRDYLGHDKVALFGKGGRPAPAAPADSPARKHGELAVREALEALKAGGPQIGERPAATPPKPSMARAMRQRSEGALMEASMRKHGSIAPHGHSGFIWARLFVPFWKALPWGLKKTILRVASGVKGWRRSG